MKGGTPASGDVLEYGEPIRNKVFTVMQGPGDDLESLSETVTSGATIA